MQWVEKKDPKTGRSYFVNAETKDASWITPTRGEIIDKTNELNDGKDRPNDDDDGWMEVADPNTGESRRTLESV